MMQNKRPSAMVPKFLQADAQPNPMPSPASDNNHEEIRPEDSAEDKYCFFYGSLMDPDMLSKVLKSSKPLPTMRPARVTGYKIKLWGPYPALLDQPMNPVDGMMCGPLSTRQLRRLAVYETDHYCLRACSIDVLNDDGTLNQTIEGVSFMWDGREDELRDGTFSLKQWKKDRQLQALGW